MPSSVNTLYIETARVTLHCEIARRNTRSATGTMFDLQAEDMVVVIRTTFGSHLAPFIPSLSLSASGPCRLVWSSTRLGHREHGEGETGWTSAATPTVRRVDFPMRLSLILHEGSMTVGTGPAETFSSSTGKHSVHLVFDQSRHILQ